MMDREAEDALRKERLFAGLYHELHRLAQRALRRDGRLLTISTTTLLHESFLSVSKAEFSDTERFLAYASRAMRGLIIDAIRRRRSLKRGSAFAITSLELAHHHIPMNDEQELIKINDALETLAVKDPPLAELVELRYFCGLSIAEIGALRGVTERTIQRQWEKARLLLFDLLSENTSGARPDGI